MTVSGEFQAFGARFAAALACAATVLAVATAARGADMQTVQFPTLHKDHVTLTAYLARPEGPGPFPAVVLAHGCDGLLTRTGKLKARESRWMEMLKEDGYAVLAVDSFNPRGFRSICTSNQRSITAEEDRPYDITAALRWLTAQPFVAKDRIAVMGWSHGGTTTLATVSKRMATLVGWSGPGFAAAVAMYPGCLNLSRTPYVATAPILMQLGLADDWTPAKFCQRLADKIRKTGGTVAVDAYAGAYHGFDEPVGKLHTRTATGGRTVHVGPDPNARAKAIVRVRAWLAEKLKQ